MTYEHIVIIKFMQTLKKRKRPFPSINQKDRFIQKFCNLLKKENNYQEGVFGICERFVRGLQDNGIPNPYLWMANEDRILYERLRKVYDSKSDHHRVTKANDEWKVPVLKFLHENPNYLQAGCLNEQERYKLYEIAKKHNYNGNTEKFREDRKNLFRTLRDVTNKPTWISSPENQALFHEVKNMLLEVDRQREAWRELSHHENSVLNENLNDQKLDTKKPKGLIRRKTDSIKAPPNGILHAFTRTKHIGVQTKVLDTICENCLQEKENVSQLNSIDEMEMERSDIWSQSFNLQDIEDNADLRIILETLCDIEETSVKFGRKKYKIKKIIGNGGFSIIYKAVKKKSKKPFALKFSTQKEFSELVNQLQCLDNPNVALSLLYQPWKNNIHAYVMELADTDLFQLNSVKVKLTHCQILQLVAQVANAVAAIHDCGYIYTDIKPENILLYSVRLYEDKNDQKRIRKLISKLTDFNSCVLRAADDEPRKGRKIQTFHYRAPEVVMKAPYNSMIDTWSLTLLAFHQISWKKLLFVEYQNKREAAEVLVRMNFEIEDLRKQLIEGDEEIASIFQEIIDNKRLNASEMQNVVTNSLSSLPKKAHSQELKRFITNNLKMDPSKRQSIHEIRDYYWDYLIDM